MVVSQSGRVRFGVFCSQRGILTPERDLLLLRAFDDHLDSVEGGMFRGLIGKEVCIESPLTSR